MKVVICCKDLSSKGGVSNFYRNLKSTWSKETGIDLVFYEIGSSSSVYHKRNKRHISYLLKTLLQLYNFYFFLKKEKPQKIIINPSLIPLAIFRDSAYLFISKKMKIDTVTFIRGWREDFFKKKDSFLTKFFIRNYTKSHSFIVLANRFKDELSLFFVGKPIYVMYTTYDDEKIVDRLIKHSEFVNMVYISRISKQKGIFELLDALFDLVDKDFTNFKIDIYGHFSDSETEEKVKQVVQQNPSLKNYVFFKGFADENIKYLALSNADIFVLPSYAEGCPNSVIEATASGCFVVSTNVGAIPEIVKDGHNAFIIQPKDKEAIKNAILRFYEEKVYYLNNCKENRMIAKKTFDINIIKSKVESILKS